MTHTSVDCVPASYQATCATCGWHTVPLRNEKQARHLASQHENVCPSPPPARNGSLMECGCWYYANVGARVGETREDCPLHGDVLMVRANVAAPSPDPGGFWIASEARVEGETT